MMRIGFRLAMGAVLHGGETGEDARHTRVYQIVTPAPPTPVSTLPLFGLGILVSPLGLFALHKLRQ
ncbi:hypothetical protein N9L80_00185 [Luminiphilus sp.]|jgi:hypothetical protein|nr:hypothetical protein [Luminiphilus sp.]